MSLLNQVLNDLEKRGADVAAVADAVRPVPRDAGRPWLVMLVVACVLLVAVATGMWWMKRKPVSAVAPLAPPVVQPVPAAKVPLQQAPVVPSLAVTAPPEAGYVAPASRLSFELSSIPLPRAEPSGKKQPHAALHAHVPAAQPKPAPAAATQGEYGGQPIKRISPQQQAQDEFGQALALIQQQRKSEAVPHLETALQLDPGHVEARRILVGLLLESRRNAEAERILQDGLQYDLRQPALAMLLARLQVERGAMRQALGTLERTLPYADREADYHAFVAAVLQRENRNKEAINHYQIALQLAPDSAVWWMGLGISQQAVDDDEDARTAFRRAADMHKLDPQLQAFVEQRLKSLSPAR